MNASTTLAAASGRAGTTRTPLSLAGRWGVATIGIAVVLIGGVLLSGSSIDLPLAAAFNALHVGVVGSVATGVYAVLEPAGAVILTVIVAAALWVGLRNLRTALVFGASVAVAWLPVGVIKVAIERPRPLAAALPHPTQPMPLDGSFPSGHSAFAVAFAIALTMVLAGTAARRWVAPLALAFVVLVLGSVLIDAVHFPSDVVASLVWSLTVTPAVLLTIQRLARPRRRPTPHRLG